MGMGTSHLINLCTVPICAYLVLLWNIRRRGGEERVVRSSVGFIILVAATLLMVFLTEPGRIDKMLLSMADSGRELLPLTGWLLGVALVLRTKPRVQDEAHPGLTFSED